LEYLGLNNLYGAYHGLNVFKEEIFGRHERYSMRLYDSNENEIGAYSFSSNSVIIPYDEEIHSAKVFIKDELKVDFFVEGIKCERDCLISSEWGDYQKGDKCCINFMRLNKGDNKFVCVKCGDGFCSEHENFYSCPEDCPRNIGEVKCSEGYREGFYGICMKGEMTQDILIQKIKKWIGSEIPKREVIRGVRVWIGGKK
jgi:hypothetical protein